MNRRGFCGIVATRSSRPFDAIAWLADPDHNAEAARLCRESSIREQAREATA